jgi:hypothetical protein
VFGGHPTNNTPKYPQECTQVGTPKHHAGTHTILFYETPPNTYYYFIMQLRTVYIPIWFVVLSLYSY